jgi:DNA-binding MarR family transcriptional regulator
VDELAAEGLVELAENPEHRRSSLVRISPSGRAVAEALFDSSSETRATMLARAGVSPEELRQASNTLRRLLDHVDDL